MMQEFFGKPFFLTLFGFLGIFALSLFGYYTQTNLILLSLVGVAVCIATFFKLEYGLFFAFLELLSNAHGHILSAQIGSFSLSLRMVIFFAVLISFAARCLLNRTKISFTDHRILLFLPIFFAVCIGITVGLTQRSFKEVFSDGNAYLYLLYLFPLIALSWDRVKQRTVLQMLAAAACFTSIMSLLGFYAYTHFSENVLRSTYVFLRDIRFGEMTQAGFGIYRIFAQTQVFVFLFGFILMHRFFLIQSKQDRILTIFFLSLVSATAIVSLSRSFWIGSFCATIFILFMHLCVFKTRAREFLKAIGFMLSTFLFSAFVLLLILFFPIPNTLVNQNVSGILSERLIDSDPASSSRWNLLVPMLELIKNEPIVGNGFGQSVTFISNDPRVRAIQENGTWTTTSMEWGWLELWLKMGLMGPVGFLFFFFSLIKKAKSQIYTEKSWLSVWVISSMIFLFITHFFSPYLNHPIGLGTLLLLVLFVPYSDASLFLPIPLFFKQKILKTKIATSVVATSKMK